MRKRAWLRRLTVGPDRFGTLLFFLLTSFVVSGATGSGWPKVVSSMGNLAALLAGFAATGLWNDRARMISLLTLGSVSAVLVGQFEQTSIPSGLGSLGQAVVLSAILMAVVRRVLSHERVGIPTLAGAVAAYFLIGLMFAWLHLAAYGFLDGPILQPEVGELPAYFSFVVLSTLGFGDVTPVHDLVKRVTAVEAVTGQIFLATLVARLVSMYGSSTATNEELSDKDTDPSVE